MNKIIAATKALNSAIDALDRIHFGGNYYAASTARDAAEEIIMAMYAALTAEPEPGPEPVRVPAEVVERICVACEVLIGDCAGIAMDKCGEWYVYEKKPSLGDAARGWEPVTGYFTRIRLRHPERHNLPTPDTLDWRESWHPRPGPPAEPRRDYVTTAIEA